MRLVHLILTGLVVLALAACGDDRAAMCGYLDLAGSTRHVQADYLADLKARAAEAAEVGRPVRLVVGTGDPLTEARVITADFSNLGGLEQQPARIARLNDLEGDVEQQIAEAQDPARHGTGGRGKSAILAGLALVTGGPACHDVVAWTDGLETADADVYRDDILTAGGQDAILDRLAKRDRIPALDGATVEFPHGGLVPQGSRLSGKRKAALDDFYAAWADRAQGTISWPR